jgi:hypothetical protein
MSTEISEENTATIIRVEKKTSKTGARNRQLYLPPVS